MQMFRSILDWLELRIDLIYEAISIKFTRYRKLWEEQNIEIDKMRCMHYKETTKLNNKITELNNTVSQKDKDIEKVKCELNTKTKEYLDLMNQYQDITFKNQNLIDEKRKLSSSKGGLNSSVRFRDRKISKLEKENQDLKNLIQRVVKESKHKLTAPTIQELRNYKLYGNKKGKRK